MQIPLPLSSAVLSSKPEDETNHESRGHPTTLSLLSTFYSCLNPKVSHNGHEEGPITLQAHFSPFVKSQNSRGKHTIHCTGTTVNPVHQEPDPDLDRYRCLNANITPTLLNSSDTRRRSLTYHESIQGVNQREGKPTDLNAEQKVYFESQ